MACSDEHAVCDALMDILWFSLGVLISLTLASLGKKQENKDD